MTEAQCSRSCTLLHFSQPRSLFGFLGGCGKVVLQQEHLQFRMQPKVHSQPTRQPGLCHHRKEHLEFNATEGAFWAVSAASALSSPQK